MSNDLVGKQSSITEDLALQAFEMSKNDPLDALLHLVEHAPKASLSSIKRYTENRSSDRFACRSTLPTLVGVIMHINEAIYSILI